MSTRIQKSRPTMRKEPRQARSRATVEAIVQAGPGGKAERYVPRGYGLAAGARVLAPRLVRRVLAGGAGEAMATSVTADREPDREPAR